MRQAEENSGCVARDPRGAGALVSTSRGEGVSEHGAYRPVSTPLVIHGNSTGIRTSVTIMTEWLLAQKVTNPGALESRMNKGGWNEVPDSLGFLTEDLAEVPWASEQPEGAEAQRTRLHGIQDRTRNTHGKESLAWCVIQSTLIIEQNCWKAS